MPVCVLRYENGKSADAISVIYRKKLSQSGSDNLHEYAQWVQNHGNENCLVLEDGLFTGVELSDLLRSLCGIEGYDKCLPLPDRTKLEKNETIIRFALGTDIGAWRVRETIAALQVNMAVEIAHEIKVLTEAGWGSLRAGTLYGLDEQGKEVLNAPDEHIISHAFLDERWGGGCCSGQSFLPHAWV